MNTYIVTGAGSGIGRATAIRLAEKENTRIVLVGRKIETLEATLRQMKKGKHIIACLDIRDAGAWKNLFRQREHGFSIEGLFANAGTGGENQYGANDRWQEIISTNLTGTYTTIMECLPYMRRSQQTFRHIVMTSSCLARFGVAGQSAYCTAKTGLLGLTRSLALELATDHILVNAICPGWVNTEMAKTSIQKSADRAGISYEKSLDDQMGLVPLQRISEPDEIAQLVNFLMCDAQHSITGQGIDINNGSFMI